MLKQEDKNDEQEKKARTSIRSVICRISGM